MTNNFFTKEFVIPQLCRKTVSHESRPLFGFSQFLVFLRLFTDASTHDFRCNTSDWT